MFYHILYPLNEAFSLFNIFRYITVRSFLAFLIATIVSIWWGKYFIEYMQKRQFGQVIRHDGPESHLKKKGTPTMGGIFLFGSVVIALLFCGNWTSIPTLVTLGVGFSYFFLGFMDDFLKIYKKNTKGVSAKGKMAWQVATGVLAAWILISTDSMDTRLFVPFYKEPLFDLGYWYILFAALVIVASSNAVNLTDGLDGLAIGPVITSSATLGLFAYLAGHRELAEYLFIPFAGHVGELSVFAAAIIGAGVGFLWYNTYPAQIFMGDVGALSLGGILGTIAVLTKNEILFVIIGGIFVMEAVSVILQVGSYKLRQKRIFKMAPIHHHFELKGWPEPKVIVRFWIISIFLAIFALTTLKIR